MSTSLKHSESTLHFGTLEASNLEGILSEQFAASKKIIITDETVFELWVEHLITSTHALSQAEIIQIPAGEAFKTIEVCTQIWEALSEYEIGRNDLIINFGGGVITDMGGFIASLFKRGLKFINIPTTLLSQVDASVGGKTGVDLGPFKNQIGVFADAQHVFINPDFLSTLPNEELISGYAEMLKHGLIADAAHWQALKSIQPKAEAIGLDLIQQSVAIKKAVVEQDHKETGLRKILNFGHTIGHAIEGYLLSQDKAVPHGYGVAWGMLAESYIAFKKEMISAEAYADIQSFISNTYPKLPLQEDSFKDLLKLMRNDKKNRENQIQMVLLNKIGEAVFDVAVTDIEILEGLKELAGE
ncbi:MAG: 3-dehydroquinate synthase [Crocinitomicaceae bacterium]